LKITIESTDRIVLLESGADGLALPAGRIWEGKTESGIYVQCVITRIAAPADADLAEFERELSQQSPPVSGPQVFPLRMVL
jgi:hypothetical protein